MAGKQKGILIVCSGFSGSGKGTIIHELLCRHESDYALSISATTRVPRSCEQDGREYFFKTREEFEKMIEKNELIEYALYVENYYGTPKAYVEAQLEAGQDVILEIEIQGARRIKELFPDALLIFISPKDTATLKERLAGRGTEEGQVVEERLAKSFEEAFQMEFYDYLLINDTVEECARQMHSIIQNEHRKMARNREFISKMQEELRCFSKGV